MSQRRPRFRSVLDEYVAYRPGKVARSPEGRSFKLSSNESPYGPLPSVREVIADAGGLVNRYPDNGCAALIGAIAARHDVPESHVAVGCGSVGVSQMLLESVGEPGVEVVYAWRSFEAYPTLADLAGVTSVRVPLTDERHDLRAMSDAITDRTGMIFVCNPNNPTGTVVGRRRAGGVPRPGAGGLPDRAGRGLPRVHPRPGGPRRARPLRRPAEPRRSCGRSPRRTAWPGCGWASWWRRSRSPRRCARPTCRSRSTRSPRRPRSPRWRPRTSCSTGSRRRSRSASGSARR